VLTVARNRFARPLKSHAYRMTIELSETDSGTTEFSEDIPDDDAIPDRRLELMLVCAHPAIAAQLPHTADVANGARHRRGGDRRGVRGCRRRPWRSGWSALNAGSAMHTSRSWCRPARISTNGWRRCWRPSTGPAPSTGRPNRRGAPIESLSAEALHLALVLAELLPDEPEALGLAALVCLSESRRPARRTADGGFVPLDEQDTRLWDAAMIARGEALLRRAHGLSRPGRYQYEAAIQSTHCARARGGRVDWVALGKLHRALLRIAPSLGAAVALAVVDGEVDGPDAGAARARGDQRSGL